MKSALLSTMVVVALASSFALTCCAAPNETSKTGGPEMVKVSGDASFKKDVLESKLPVFVDFYADWCGPCRALSPVLEEISEDYKGKVNVFKVNTEETPELAALFGVRGIPALLFIPKTGEPAMSSGFTPKENLQKAIFELFGIK